MHHSKPLAVLFLLLLSSDCLATAVFIGVGSQGSGVGAAAKPLQPCLEELLPCTAYLKGAKRPPQTCCSAMQRAVDADQLPCLCRLFADAELLRTFNVTKEEMLRLPVRCSLPPGCGGYGAGSPEPVVDAPSPPSDTSRRVKGGDSSKGGGFRSSIGYMTASVWLGAMVSIFGLF